MGIWGLSHCFWGRRGVILQTGNAPGGAFRPRFQALSDAFGRFWPRQRRNGFAKARRTSKKATHPRGPWGRAPLWGAGRRQGGTETQPPEDKRCCRRGQWRVLSEESELSEPSEESEPRAAGSRRRGDGDGTRQGGRRDEDAAGRTRRGRHAETRRGGGAETGRSRDAGTGRGGADAGVLKPAPPPKIKTAEAGAPCGGVKTNF